MTITDKFTFVFCCFNFNFDEKIILIAIMSRPYMRDLRYNVYDQ